MSTPRFSVVIDNYNYGRFLPEAIDSALAQNAGVSMQIIVVDDGSTDDSREVLKRYEGRVESIFQENQGYSAAFNAGIRRARGEFVCLLDADDVWKPNKVSEVLKAFEANPEAGVVQHFLQDTDGNLKPLPQDFPQWPPRTTIEDYLEGRAEFTATSGLSFRANVLSRSLPIPTELKFLYADDYMTVLALLDGAGANIPEALGFHRVHGRNFCAGSLGDPGKIAADFLMRKVFRDSLDRRLEARGMTLRPRFRRLEDLELYRREILHHMHEGRRTQAAAVWLRGFMRFVLRGFGLFRVATCALALISPALYLRVYQGYSHSSRAKGLRRRLLPA